MAQGDRLEVEAVGSVDVVPTDPWNVVGRYGPADHMRDFWR